MSPVRRRNAKYYKLDTTGRDIVMTCYTCETKTLTFDEARRTWWCAGCQSLLATDEAVERIAAAITGATPALTRTREVA